MRQPEELMGGQSHGLIPKGRRIRWVDKVTVSFQRAEELVGGQSHGLIPKGRRIRDYHDTRRSYEGIEVVLVTR